MRDGHVGKVEFVGNGAQRGNKQDLRPRSLPRLARRSMRGGVGLKDRTKARFAPLRMGRFPRSFETRLRVGVLGVEELHGKYAAVFRDLFIESNPGPVKAAMAVKGWLADELRLPLVPMMEENRKKLFATLKQAGLT